MLQQLAIALLAFSRVALAMGPVGVMKHQTGWAEEDQVERLDKRTSTPGGHGNRTALKYYNEKTAEFYVDGKNIPEVTFDVGESYSGLLPISKNGGESRKLFFWFFPTTGSVDDELVIWLNGGPGCSSLEGFLQENGPFFWQYGTFRPVTNPYSWHKLTNMLWVEQPVGTGFSQGVPSATSELDVAAQFLGFLENFITTFGMQRKKLYMTGESYAGQYIPYIVDEMYNRADKNLFDVRGLMIYDPSIAPDVVLMEIPALPFVEYWDHLLGLDQVTMDSLRATAETCGYKDYLSNYLVYPPPGPLPTPPQLTITLACDIWGRIKEAATRKNPCFNVYHITTTCPHLWDVLGFPGTNPYLPEGADIYFAREDVQDAIHAPHINWKECPSETDPPVFVGGIDTSDPSGFVVLPRVIDKNERTVISNGMLDFRIISAGTLLAIQGMTWGGQQGFQQKPTNPFVVPYDNQGIMGTVHTERKLTWVEVALSGHMVPQYQPGAAYRMLEYLLGRIPQL